jgi:hypothetical protein
MPLIIQQHHNQGVDFYCYNNVKFPNTVRYGSKKRDATLNF